MRRKPRLWEQLEERCLFDAAGNCDPAELMDFLDETLTPAQSVATESQHDATSSEAAGEESSATSLIFVDTAVEDFDSLLSQIEIDADTEVIFLSPVRDGLEQITDELLGRNGIDAVHIISHGGSGELKLGNTIVRTEDLQTRYADDLREIAGSLTSNADFLFYGCRLGEGNEGRQFVETLASLTGADVAASDDLTGNALQGGDWSLEVRLGEINTTLLSATNWSGVLAVEATDLIVTVEDAENSGAGTVSLTNNGSPLSVTTTGTPLRVAQMLETIWQFSETADVGESTYVFDITGIAGINGSIASDFGLIISDQADLSGPNTTTLVASGYDDVNNLIYFRGVDLDNADYFGLATEVVADNFSVFPTASGLEDSSIDLGLTLNDSLINGGTLRDIIDTAAGFRQSTSGTASTDFFIPAGTTAIKIVGFSTRDINTTTNDATNDDYQTLNASIDLISETSNGYIAHIIDQGPSRSDQFGWSDAPLGTAVLSGSASVTGDFDDNINPTFSITDGVLQIVENHQLQTVYHVEFLTNATSSAEFIQTESAVREDGDQAPVTLSPPASADYVILSIADAATSSDSQVEYKGNSRIYIDLNTLTASGAVAAQRGETDDRVISYGFEDYDVSSSTVGSVLSSGASIVGDAGQNAGLLNDSQIYLDGSGNIVIERESTFADNFNSLVTVEYYERRDVGSSADLLGESTAYGLWETDPSDPVSTLEFDIPPNATLGILNLSANGTRTSNTNENVGFGFAVIDLVNGISSGSLYMVRTGNIVDFVAWDGTDIGDVFFDDPNTISNHTNINQFNDEFPGNASFNLINNGETLELSTHSEGGTQTFLDYLAGGQIEWYGTAPFELSGFPVGGTFSQGNPNTATGNWELSIQEALAGGLFFVPDEHVSGTQPIDISIRIGDETDTTQVRVEAVIDPISFDAPDACGHEDTDIPINLNVTPTFVDQDGSETITAMSLSNIPVGHTVTDGTNTFTATAGNQSVDITGWNRAVLTYRPSADEAGTFTIDLEVDWQDVGGGVTDTDSLTTSFDIVVKPVNDAPVAVNDFYTVLGNTTLNVPLATGVLSNDSDVEGDTLTATLVPMSGPSNGSLTLNPNGTFTYIPTTGFFGTDSFDYQVSDGNGGFATATAFIDVSEPVIGPLEAVDDVETTPEETLINIDVIDNDNTPTSGAFNISSTTPPSNGTITVLANGTIDYTPNANFFGVDTFTYTLSDASGRMSTATVEVTVTNTQDPPTANADSGSTPEDVTLANINILANDSDPDNDTLTVTSATSPNGTIVINADGTIDYTPNLDFNGTDTVTYTISDGNGGTATSTVLINVVPVADPPTSADNKIDVDEDGEYIFTTADFAFTDGDANDSLTTVRIDTLPSDGDVLFMGSPITAGQVVSIGDIVAGRLAFVPDPDGFGNPYTSFTFSVSDGALFQVTPNTMTICVIGSQDPPIASDHSLVVAEESVATPLGIAAPIDVDGDALTITVTGLPTLGTVFLADGVTPVTNNQMLTIAELTSLVYDAPSTFTVPNAGDFVYDVFDGTDTDSGVVDITITPVNDAPTIDLNGAGAGEDFKSTFTEGGGAVAITDASIDIADQDSSALQSITISVGGIVDAADEVLTIGGVDFFLNASTTQNVTVAGVTFSVAYSAVFGGGTFAITQSGGGDFAIAAAEALLAGSTYRNDSPFPTTTNRTFDIQVADEFGAPSNVPQTVVCVVRDAEIAAWTLTGTTTVVDSATANYSLDLSAPLRNGETASVDLSFTDIDTDSGDYNAFNAAVVSAVTAYSGPGALAWNGTTLVFTSDGTGAMSTLAIAITTTPDGVFEGDEDYTISLSSPASTTGETISLGTSNSVTTTITDNTPPPTVTISDASIVEGSPLVFTVSLDLASHEDITLDLIASSGTATVVTDFENTNFEYFNGTAWVAATNGTEITLPALTTSLQVRIDTVSETLVELDETFTLSAAVLSGTVTSATDTGTGTIVNDDMASISIDDVTVDEDVGTLTFTVSLDQPSALPVTVDYATSSGTATSGVDFASTSGMVTFNPNQQSATITVNITNDNLFEQSESFDVTLSSAVGASTSDAVGVGTIIDDGTGPNGSDDDRPTFSIDNVTATETVDMFAVFTISLTNPSVEDISLSLALVDITATSGADFGPGLEFFDGAAWQSVTGNVTIPAAATSLQVRTPILDDAIIDTGETYSLVATHVSGTTLNSSATGTGTILDDPTPDVTEVEIAGPGSVTEGTSATYTVTLDNVPLTDVTVTFTFAGTAGPTDYTGVGSVTIPAGSTTAMFTVPTIDDTLGEPLENFVVTINSVTGGALEATLISATNNSVTTNIIDDDTPVISISDVVVTEGVETHAEFTVELSNPTFEDIDFSIATMPITATGDGVDFGIPGPNELEVFDGTTWTPLTSTTITAGTTSIRLRTPIQDDAIGESLETFDVTVTTTGGTTLNPSATGTGSIQEDLTAPETVLVSIAGPPSVVEGATTTPYTVSLTHIAVEDVTVTLNYSGVASDGTDFAGAATITIPTGSISATFTLPTVNDAHFEGDEDIVVTIVGVAGGGFESIAPDTTADQVTTLIIDDADTPTISVNDVTSIEGTDDFAVYTIELSNLSIENVDVSLSLNSGVGVAGAIGGGTDFGAGGAGNLQVFNGLTWVDATTATIPAGQYTVQVRTPIINDSIDEPTENYSLTVDVTAGTTTNIQVIGTGTIIDDDPAPDVTIDDAMASEGDPLIFDVTLSNPSSADIILDFSAADGSAVSATDYNSTAFDYSTDGGVTWIAAVGGTQVMIPANLTAIQVRLATTEDSTLETTETMQLSIGSVIGGVVGDTTDTAIGTIIDDDSAVVSIIANDPIAGEAADNGQFTVALSNPSDTPTTINYTVTGTASSGNDFVALPGTITLPAGTTTETIDLTVIDDAVIEGIENVTITLTTIASGDADIAINTAADTATATITDDDNAIWTLTGTTSVNEGASAIYDLNLVGTLQNGENATIELGLTDNTTNSADHAALASSISDAVAAYTGPGLLVWDGVTTLTFTSDGTGAMAQLSIFVAATNDAVVEGVEDYTVSISSAGSTTGAGVAIDTAALSVNTTIHDTIDAAGTALDSAEWSITGPTAQDEGATAQYTVSLDASLGLNETASVVISLTDIDTNSSDYGTFLTAVTNAAAANSSVSFDASTGTLTFTAPTDGALMTDLVVDLSITNDAFIEGPEDFRIDLSAAASSTGAAIGIDATAASVTTTINDTQGIAGAPDGPALWSITGVTSVDEGATAQYVVSLTGQFGANESVTVDLGLTDLSTNASDYASITAAISTAVATNANVSFNATTGTLTYTAPSDGASMADLIINLGITNDAFIEGPEDFTLALSGAMTSTGAAVSIDTTAESVTTTIDDTQGPGGIDDGPAIWSITGTVSADEGTTAVYTVSLAGQFGAGEIVTVDLGLTDVTTNSSDYASIVATITVAANANPDLVYNSASGTLTYTAPVDGATLSDLVINVGITDDAFGEGPEDFTLALSNATTSTGAAVIIDATADDVTTTIDDTQGPLGAPDGPAIWTITGPTAEDEGTTPQYIIALQGSLGANETVSVQIDLADITTNANDYASIDAAISAAIAGDASLAYDAASNILTYTAPADGATMAPIIVGVLLTNDAYLEGVEQFSISLSNPSSASGAAVEVHATDNSVTTTINDVQGPGLESDGPGVWSITGSISEDEGATANYRINLSPAFGINETATVVLSLTDVDTNSTDYANFATAVQNAISGDPTLSFDSATGVLTYTSPSDGSMINEISLDLAIANDSLIEGPEDYTISLSNPGSTTGLDITVDAADDAVTTTINDTQGVGGPDDGPGVWSITGQTSADEGATAQYTVSLSGQFGAGEIVTVELNLVDNTTNSSDYSSINAAITAAANANPDVTYDAATGTLIYTAPSDGASMTDLVIDLGITNDALIEGPEDFTLALTNAMTSTGAAVIIDTAADDITTVIDDTQGPLGASDGPALWSITGSTSADEGATAQYTVSLSGQFGAGEIVTVQLNLTDNSTNPSDYASITAAITAAANSNPDVSYNAATGTLTYTAPSDGASMADLVIDLGITNDAFIEGPEDFTLALTNATTSTGAAVAIDTAADDVTTVIDDTQGPLGAADGPAVWSITGPTSADEGSTAQYTVSLSGQFGAGETVAVQLNLADNTTNSTDYSSITAAITAAANANPDVSYNAATGTLTYTAPSDGASMTDLVIDLGITNDSIVEGPEDFTLALTNATTTTGAAVAIDTAADDVTTVIDDTQGPLGAPDGPAIWSITGSTSADEGSTAQYTVSLSGQFGAGQIVTVDLNLTDNTTNSSDYASITAAITAAANANPNVTYNSATDTLTYTAPSDGASMADLVIDLSIANDSLIEGPEDFTLALTNATTSTGATVAIDPAADDVTTVIDDTQGPLGAPDGPALWSIIGPVSANEGSTAQYTVSLSGQFGAGESVAVQLNLTDNTTNSSDYDSITAAITAAANANPDVTYNAATGTLTYTAPSDGASMTDLVIDLGITMDALIEGPEDFTLALTNATSSTGAAIAIDTADDVTTVIDDAQDAIGPALWSITGPVSADEGTTARYTVSLPGQFGVGEIITVQLTLIDNTTNSSDYSSITAAITAAANANPDVTYNAGTGTLTYTSPSDGASLADLVIDLGITNDAFIEGPEEFTLVLTNATTTTGAAVGIDPAAGDVTTIIDDTQGPLGAPDGPALWSITGTTSADEGAAAQYTVSLSGQFGTGEVVTVDLNLTETSTNSSDYDSITAAITAAANANPNVTYNAATGTLTYTAPFDGASMADLVIDLGIANDALIEGPEDFTLALTNASTSTGAAVAIDPAADDVTTVIDDTQGPLGAPDGPALWSITGPTSADEGATPQYTVSLSGQFGAGEIVSVQLNLVDNTTNSSDYSSITAAITAAANANPYVTYNTATGRLTYTAPSDGASMADLVIDLGITNDALIEGPEDFTLALTSATTSTGAAVAIDTAADDVTTVIDDTQGPLGAADGPALWSITGSTSADEGATAQYTVSLSGQFGAGEIVTVQLNLADNTTNSSDRSSITAAITAAANANPHVTYNAATGTLTYTAPSDGASMADLVIDLGITNDAFIEGPEDFTLALTNATTPTGADVAIDTAADDVTTVIDDTQGPLGPADGPALWSITGPTSADEGATAQYTVSLSGQFGINEMVSVQLNLTNNTTNPGDYASITAAITAAANANSDVSFNAATGTLTYTAPSDGASMTDLVIDLGITNDSLIEGPEDFTLALTNATTSTDAAVAIDTAADDVTTVINDTQGPLGAPDGPALWSITGPASTDEGATAQYTVSLSGQFGAGEIVSVQLNLTDNTTNSSDYSSIAAAITAAANANPNVTYNTATGTLTYTAPSDGASMADLVIDLGITNDAFIEGPEDFTLALTNATTSTGATVGIDTAADDVTTVIDDTQGPLGAPDGPALWSITGSTSADEGTTAQYTVSLSGQFGAGEIVAVQLNLADNTTNSSDYSSITAAITAAANANPDVTYNAATGTLTYTAPSDGASMADLVIDLGITNDALIEGPEDFTLALTNATTSTGAAIAVDTAADDVTTVIDDIQGTLGPALWSITGSTSADEGSVAQYTVSLSGQFGAGEIVTVDLNLTDNTTNPSDYSSISAAIAAAANANPDVTYNAGAGTLTYTAPSDGASMADLVIDLGITNDSLIEGPEDFTLALTNATTSTGADVAIDTAADDVTTVIDDTQGPLGAPDGPALWSITGPTSADEGATAQYTVSLSGQFGASEIVSVQLNLTDNTTSPSDYASITAAIAAAAAADPDVGYNTATGTLTYTAPSDGATMTDLIINLMITDDAILEGPEDFTLALTNAMTSTGAAVTIDTAADDVTTVINDTQGPGGATDGPALWSITGPATADEGATAVYTVSLASQFGAGEIVTVDLRLSDNTTNSLDYASIAAAITAAAALNPDVTYNSATGTLTYIAPTDGAMMADLVIDLGITNDSLIEGPEDFTLTLTNATTSTGVAVAIDTAADDVTTVINDTQGPGGLLDGPALWSITGPAEVAEGTNANYTIALTGSFQAGEIVSVNITQSDNSTNSADYGNLQNQIAIAVASDPNLSFNPATGTLTYTVPSDGAIMTPLVVSLPITDDAIIENPEDFDIILSGAMTTTGANVLIDSVANSVNTTINGDPHLNDDIQRTTVNTSVSDNVLLNDTDPDGDPLTVSTTPATPPTNGTVTILPNGDYTYTPDPGFRGVDTFDYEACDDMGNCEIATVTIMIADLSVSKQQTNVVPNGEDFNVTFVVTVENTGSTRMDNLTLFDNIQGQFGGAFQSVSNPILDPTGIVGGIAPILNPAWPSNTAADLLWPAVVNEFLLPGDSFTITYTVTIDPDVSGTSGYLSNQATVAGDDITTIPTSPLAIADDSDSGDDPATNNIDEPGDTGGNNDPTPVFIADLGVAKQQTGTPSQLADGTWNIDFELFVENTGTVDLASPTLFDDVQSQLSTAWQGSSNLAIDTSGVSLGGIAPGLNSLWLADPTQNLFDGTGILRPGESVRVTFTLNIDPDDFVSGLSQPLSNQAIGGGTATDSNGNTITDASQNPIIATDRSDSGADANTDNSGAPGDSGATDDPTPLILPEIGAAKQIIATAAATTPGNTNVTYEIVLRNIGTVDLVNLTLTEDIQSTIGGAFVGIVGSPVIASSTASTNPTFNAAWDGNLDGVGNANLFDGTSGLLTPGEQIVVRFTAELDVDQLTNTSHNQVVASGQYDPTPATPGDEVTVSDLSDTGSDPSNNNPGITGDSAGEDDATLIPALGVAKDHGDPIAVGENFLLPVTLYLENLGSTDLANLTLIDNLQSQLGAAFAGVSNVTIDDSFVVGGTSPNINPSWTGNGANILSGGLLAPGDNIIVTFDVLINPDAGGTSSSLSNAAVASATDPSQPGIVVSDVSDSGTDPSGGEDVTPINIPDAGVAKQVTNLRQVGAQFELTIEIVLENTGTVDLTNLLLADDLAAQFGTHFQNIIGAPTITTSTASVNPNLNASYVGDTTQNLFDSTSGLLEPGQAIVVELRVLVDAAGDGSTTLVNQATGGGVPVDANGNQITDSNDEPVGLVTDDSDTGSDPNGNNPDAPGDTGRFDDPTETRLQFFTFDALNNFAKGFGPDESIAAPSNRLLSKLIPSLAPEPVFSGTARPGTQIIGRVFDSSGHLVGESISVADVGGNWMMQMHNARNVENARIEFTEIVGSSQTFAPNGDIYGYLGIDQQSNHYASLEPWTGFEQAYDFNAVLSGTARQRLARMHQQNSATIGLASS